MWKVSPSSLGSFISTCFQWSSGISIAFKPNGSTCLLILTRYRMFRSWQVTLTLLWVITHWVRWEMQSFPLPISSSSMLLESPVHCFHNSGLTWHGYCSVNNTQVAVQFSKTIYFLNCCGCLMAWPRLMGRETVLFTSTNSGSYLLSYLL